MKTNSDWIQQADQALQRAAKRARELAERTNTPLHVMRNGKIVKVMPGAGKLALREESPGYGRKPSSSR